MTRDNLIFLGACTILSSNPMNFTEQTALTVDGYTTTQQERIEYAIKWSALLYDKVHTKSVWEVQCNFFDGWARSSNEGLQDTFPSKEEAEVAMEKHKGVFNFYRVREIT